MNLSYPFFRKATLNIFQQIKNDRIFKPDMILCVARGGLLLGAQLAYDLNIKNIESINIKFYDDDSNETLKKPEYMGSFDLSNLKGNILIVDDVSDTGETLKSLISKIPDSVNYRIATIYMKDKSIVLPNYYWKKVKMDEWITFPWNQK